MRNLLIILILFFVSPVFACDQYQMKTYPDSYQISVYKNNQEIYGNEESNYVKKCLINPDLEKKKYSDKLSWYLTQYALNYTEEEYNSMNYAQKQEFQKYAKAYIINFVYLLKQEGKYKGLDALYIDYSDNCLAFYLRIIPKVELQKVLNES